MLLKAPFRLPSDFLAAFGYSYGRRFVALYWEPCGDEACYDDGQNYACGMVDNWLYLDFVHQPQVSEWLSAHGINLGSSDEPAQHWIVTDRATGDLYAALPSLHVGWNLLVGLALLSATTSLVLKVLACLMPALMAWAVVATANHYVVDVLAGIALVLVGHVVALALERRRIRHARLPS